MIHLHSKNIKKNMLVWWMSLIRSSVLTNNTATVFNSSDVAEIYLKNPSKLLIISFAKCLRGKYVTFSLGFLLKGWLLFVTCYDKTIPDFPKACHFIRKILSSCNKTLRCYHYLVIRTCIWMSNKYEKSCFYSCKRLGRIMKKLNTYLTAWMWLT